MKGEATLSSLKDLASQILARDRRALAKAITLVESRLPADRLQAQELLEFLRPHTGESKRVGISGPPGVGKSTLMEAFGSKLLSSGEKLAVLAVDPTSPISGGSILGDKTRMQRLANHDHAFIRPSPSQGILGGVARRTREAILLCEAAGYQWIFVETVGVGQSEVMVAKMVDIFLTLQLPNAGDELQGIKKGILELADIVILNKHDGLSKIAAEQSSQFLTHALQMVRGRQNRTPPVLCVSSLLETGLDEVRAAIDELFEQLHSHGNLEEKRNSQNEDWFREEVFDLIRDEIQKSDRMQKSWLDLEEKMRQGSITPGLAAQHLVQELLGAKESIK